MSETRRPKPCHHDRNLGGRVTNDHRDDCPTALGTGPCPAAGQGCAPCTAPHCVICGRRHLDNDHPLTCPECISSVRTDLDDIRWSCRHLRWQASRAGRDGRLLAAAPIPGGDAMVLLASTGVFDDDLRTYPGWTRENHEKDHPPPTEDYAGDVVPPLLPLLAWEHVWRVHFDHLARTVDRAPVTAITRYLAEQLTVIAQSSDGPDWPGFARDMGALRRELELVLHDEREPETGVSCFECGDRLVRRFGKPRPCRHVAEARRAGVTVTHWVYVLSTYPELGEDHAQCRDQGGIVDPSVGQSWECPGCRKAYTPGEYANAVRRDLLEGGPDGDGWTHVAMAAAAASTATGYGFTSNTVRKWMDRGVVGSLCQWSSTVEGARAVPTPGQRESFAQIVAEFRGRVVSSVWGLRLVRWHDVAEQAAAAVLRHERAEAERRRRAEQAKALAEAIAKGEKAEDAGKRLGIHPARVKALVGEWEAARESA